MLKYVRMLFMFFFSLNSCSSIATVPIDAKCDDIVTLAGNTAATAMFCESVQKYVGLS